MNEDVVDLTNLRLVTDGDPDLERELFDEFITSSVDLVTELEAHCAGENSNEDWRKSAHALKGIAANLGASHLAEISKQGQEGAEKDLEWKVDLLGQIKQEREKVVAFLQAQSA